MCYRGVTFIALTVGILSRWQDTQHNTCHLSDFPPLHVLRWQLDIALSMSFPIMVLISLQRKCVNEGIFWTLIHQYFSNMVHKQYNISWTLNNLELESWKKKQPWVGYITPDKTPQARGQRTETLSFKNFAVALLIF